MIIHVLVTDLAFPVDTTFVTYTALVSMKPGF
jgi:hypothetical protein